MDRVRVEGDVEIDVCDEHGVWLDRGELERIVTHHERAAMQGAQGRAGKTRSQRSTLARVGERVVAGAASGAGFGAGSTLARALVRKLLG